MFAFAILAFVMSILWISFTCDFVIDLLWIIGLVFGLPKPLLGFTLLAVGNCLGDLNANVAMTKIGFGEMAVTGCLAGPVFNILMGLGMSTIKSIADPNNEDSFYWSLYKKGENGEATDIVDPNSVLPMLLIISLMVAIILVFVNGALNNYNLTWNGQLTTLLFYFFAVIGICVYVGVGGVEG